LCCRRERRSCPAKIRRNVRPFSASIAAASLRQALCLYQVMDARLSSGVKLDFENERNKEKVEQMVL